MPARESLLERIADAGRGSGRSLRTNRSSVIQSVVRNLHRILNTRQGSAGAQPELGIPSPHELFHDYPASLLQAQQAMRQCIMRYEPRLTGVTVETSADDADDPLSIRFSITARVIGDETRQPFRITTSVDQDGEIRVDG